jgi:hypothetical protein
MERKGEILNQLAIISDLLENANLDAESKSVIFIVDKKEYDKMFDTIVKKTKVKFDTSNTFTVKIGEVEYIFTMAKKPPINKNNV